MNASNPKTEKKQRRSIARQPSPILTEKDQEPRTITERIERIIKQVNQGLIDRDEVVKLAIIALVSGESLFLLGPPGTAKSMVSRKINRLLRISGDRGAECFTYLLNRYSTPDEIFGPISIQGLKEDRYERKTKGYLPTAHVAFLDEIWKASPAILNALLTALSEKVYRNGQHEETLPLELCIAASNELPEAGEGLDAIWDRFLLRAWVGNLETDESFLQLILGNLEEEVPETGRESLLLEELEQWREEIKKVTFSEELKRLILRLKKRVLLYNRQIDEERDEECTQIDDEDEAPNQVAQEDLDTPLYVSDRRWRKIANLIKTIAFLSGRMCATAQDLWIAPYCMWNRPEQLPMLSSWVNDDLGGTGAMDPERSETLLATLRPVLTSIEVELKATQQLTELQQGVLKTGLTKGIKEVEKVLRELQECQQTDLSGSPLLLGEALKSLRSAFETQQQKLVTLKTELKRLAESLHHGRTPIQELIEQVTLSFADLEEHTLPAQELQSRKKVPKLAKKVPKLAQLKGGDRVHQVVDQVQFMERVIPDESGGAGFVMMETQVTQELYQAVMGNNPSHFKGAQLPVEKVSWKDGIKFCNALSERLGLQPAYRWTDYSCELIAGANGFRLPFEAEWEWAAKGGQAFFRYAGSNNLGEVGWYHDNSGERTHPVGQKKPNGYGLYDMSGNVEEWCADDYDNPGEDLSWASNRVIRGGRWDLNAGACQVSYRSACESHWGFDGLGLRLSRSVR